MNQGKIEAVMIMHTSGVVLTAAAIGETVITLDSADDFDVAGGRVMINSIIYAYQTVTPGVWSTDPSTITLSSALTASVAADDRVYLYPLSEEKWALVNLPSAEDALWARVPQGLAPQLADGIREVYDQESAWVEYVRGQGWKVNNLNAQVPVIRGQYVDPSGMDGIQHSDSVAPTYAPGIAADGGIGMVFVTLQAIVNNDPVDYEYHTYAVAGTVPTAGDPATVVYLGPDAKILVRTTPGGSPLAYGTPYYFRAFAKDKDGYGPVSAEVMATPKRVEQDDVSADYVYANDVLAGQVRTGVLDAVIAIAQEIYTGATGRRIGLSAENGLTAIDQDGNVVASIPTDLLRDISLNADLVAKSVTALGPVALRSSFNEIAQNASLIMRVGSTAPVTPLSSSIGWNVQRTSPNADYAGFNEGATFYAPGSSIIAVSGGFGSMAVQTINRTTGLVVSTEFTTGPSMGFDPISVVRIGSFYYILGTYTNRYRNSNPFWRSLWVAKYSLSGSRISEWEFGPTIDLRDRRPTMGYSAAGTGLAIAYSDQGSSDAIRIVTMANPDSAAITANTLTNVSYVGQLSSIMYTQADTGVSRYIVSTNGKSGGDVAYQFDSGGGRQADTEFPLSTGASVAFLLWDSVGNYFRQASDTDNVFTTYDGTTWVGASVQNWKAANSWRDDDVTGGSVMHETAMGPVSTIAMKKRARLMMSAPPIPSDANNANHDDANSVRFYVGNQATGVYTNMWLQASPAAGVTNATVIRAVFNNTDTLHPNPQQFGDFPLGTPGKVASDDEMYYFDGEGKLVAKSINGVATMDTGWVDTPLDTTKHGNTSVNVGSRRIHNRVSMRGFLNATPAGGFVANTTYLAVGTLAVAARPGTFFDFYAAGGSAASGARVRVNTNGTIDVYTGASAPSFVSMGSCPAYLTD